MWRLAVLHHHSSDSPLLLRLQEALRRRGLTEDAGCAIRVQGADGRLEHLPRLMHDLLQSRPNAVAAIGAVAAMTAQRATSTIPVLHAMVVDPVHIGLAAANLTGVTTFDPGLASRQLQTLRMLLPDLRSVACLTDNRIPKGSDGKSPLCSSLDAAARREGLALHTVALEAQGSQAVSAAYEAIRQTRADALIALEVPAVLQHLDAIAAAALEDRLPTMFPAGTSAPSLIRLGAGLRDAVEALADLVDALAQGVQLSSLPTRHLRSERLVVDLGVASSIELRVPRALISRATELRGV